MIFLYIILGFLGGILSGMGLGGGTLLIPLLTTILGLSQKQAQFLNIFSFVFMAVFVVLINMKNKIIDVFPAIIFSIPGIFGSVVSSFFVKNISNEILKTIFGIFLIVLALFQLFLLIKNNKNVNKN